MLSLGLSSALYLENVQDIWNVSNIKLLNLNIRKNIQWHDQ